MKKHYSSITARVTISTLFLIASIILVVLALSTTRSRSATPTSGTIAGPTGSPLAWDGDAIGTGSGGGEDTCVENNPHLPGDNCDTFTLTVGGTQADWATAGKRIQVKITPPASQDDYDLVIHKTDNSGTIIDSSGNGAGVPEVAHISPATDGVGVFTVHVVYFAVIPADQYHGTATVVPLIPPPPPLAPEDTGPKLGYENFEAPGVLTPVTTTTGPTVEYMGRGAGEPSIGVNWNSLAPNDVTGVTNFQSDLETLFITFANACPTGGPTATWANRAAPTSQAIDSDPIGFTDRLTGRVFAAELTATSPTCKISYTDDDGNTWVPSSGPLGSGIDHETVGGGPYHAPIPPGVTYPNAVYYCSQDLVAAFCLRSDDGGVNFGPVIPTYTTECGGLHGHVKVSPVDGTVYLPNNNCGGDGAVVVSEDNGITWQIRHVGNASVQTASGASDPAVGIDSNGRVYFAIANADAAAAVATSDDHGSTWNNIFDVSSVYGLKNIRYPAAVAADAGRAAVAFYGSTTAGSADSGTFKGIWHLYVAHTFDGGLHWTTSDATPGAPMQRGNIWTGGGANIGRNLLDFFGITVDKQGRVQVGYVNGCPGGNCAQAPPTATGNGYSATGTIARQSSGRRLVAAFDPPSPLTATSVPGMPSVTQRRVGPVVHLGWSEADTGNSPITSYQILRGTASGGETLLTTVPGTSTRFDDPTATDSTKTYFYKVVAVNAVGASCGNNEVAAPFVGDTCTSLVIHTNDPAHPESAAANANPQLAIDYVAVGEPPATSNLLFKMKVSDLTTVPPNSRWRMVWDSFSSPGQQYFVGMRSDENSAVTFEYGTIATAVVGLVVGVPTETFVGTPLPASNFNADGTITIFVPKSAVGNPQPGDLLGAMNGRTFTGDTPGTMNLERSTALIDHTFVKAQTDNAFPPATYTVAGNVACGAISNTLPTADLKAAPTSGNAPLNVAFDASGSFDPDFADTIASYTFKFGDGSNDVTQGSPFVNHTYASAGTYTARLVVTDSRGGESSNPAEQVITVTQVSPTPTPTGTPSPTPGGTPSPTPTATPAATPVNVQLLNISGRVFAKSDDKVGIGGFIISGSGTKRIMARAIGPSLNINGTPIPGRLQDPYLELHDSSGSPPLINDNWRSTQEAEIQQTGLAPTDDRESAIVKRLPAGNYTAIIRGADGSPGIGLVELYDLSSTDPGELGNLSVRADVGTDDNVLFDGLILRGGTPKRVVFRAIGPSIRVNGAPVPGSLQDPTLEVHDGNGALLGTNNDWKDAPNRTEIESSGLAPTDDRESAILLTIPAGNYTSIVRGVNRTTGIALAEAYKLNN